MMDKKFQRKEQRMTATRATAMMVVPATLYHSIKRHKDDRDNQQSTTSSAGSIKAMLMA